MAPWNATLGLMGRILKVDPDADVSDLRAQYKAELFEDRIRKLVAAAPPLTLAQKDALVALLRTHPTDHGEPQAKAG